MKRTQQEILNRIKQSKDLFGTQIRDLVPYLDFDLAKPYLNDDFLKKVERGEEAWTPSKDPKNEIINHLDFAYEKAEDRKSLSAARSMLHFRSWIWLEDPKFYDEVIDLIDNYTNYGIPALDKISAHYGFKRNRI